MRTRTYNAAQPDKSLRRDPEGRLWLGGIIVGTLRPETKKQAGDWLVCTKRINEVARLLDDRQRVDGLIIEGDDLWPYVEVVFRALKHMGLPSPSTALGNWTEIHCPDFQVNDSVAVQLESFSGDRVFIHSADEAAKALGLNFDDRQRLRIETIGATDLDKNAREARRKANAKLRAERHRRAKGVLPRAEYLETVQKGVQA